MAQETFEQTQRRLGLGPGSATAAASTFQPVGPPKKARRPGRTIAILAGLAVLGGIGYNIAQTLPDPEPVVDEWTAYPGTAFSDSDDILAQKSLEQTKADSDALLAELADALAEFDFEWTTQSDGSTTEASNGYGGTSMLYYFDSAALVGAVQLDDPDARQRVIDIFAEVMAGHPGSTTYVLNDEAGSGDDAEYMFGSSDRDEQALWTSYSYSDKVEGLQGALDVYDASVPVGDDFSNIYWVPQDTSATLFVRFSTFAAELLSEDDRDAFIAALEPYEGQTKPAYRD